MTQVRYYQINPVPKPRMTQRDKFAKRPAVQRYWAFKDEVKLRQVLVPEQGAWLIFHIPMPKSWSKAKKARMYGMPHQTRPDKDNLEKGLLDAVFGEDMAVWDGRTTKVWSYRGQIEIRQCGETYEPEQYQAYAPASEELAAGTGKAERPV